MRVCDLIAELKECDQALEVCRADSERGDQRIEKIEEGTAVSPSIRYLVLR